MSYRDHEDFNPFANIITELPGDFGVVEGASQNFGDRAKKKQLYCDRGVYDFVITKQSEPTRDQFDPTWARHRLLCKNAAGQEAQFDIHTYSSKVTFTFGTFESPAPFQRLEQFLKALGVKVRPSAPGSKVSYDLADLAVKLPEVFSNDWLVGRKFRGTYGYPKKTAYAKFVGGAEKYVLCNSDTDEEILIGGERVTAEDKKAFVGLCKANKIRFKLYCDMIEFAPIPEA